MFFAPILPLAEHTPPPAVLVVRAPAEQPVVQPVVSPKTLPNDLQRVVTVPAEYKWGACQAVARVAWDIGYSFSGNCERYNRTTPLPLRYGVEAPAADWLNVLAHQLPPDVLINVDPSSKSISVTP